MQLRKIQMSHLDNVTYSSIKVWLPSGDSWYNVFTREKIEGTGSNHSVDVTIDSFGLFARAGTIIPICNVDK